MISNHTGELPIFTCKLHTVDLDCEVLSNTGEADEVGTETKSSTLTGSHTDRRRDQVEYGEDGRSNERKGGDFIERQALAGDKDSSTSYNETFN